MIRRLPAVQTVFGPFFEPEPFFFDLGLVEAFLFFAFGFVAFAVGSGLGKLSWAAVRPRLYMFVSQTGHFPRVAGDPLAAHSAFGSTMILFSLHLRQ